jgi:hypothetical protein
MRPKIHPLSSPAIDTHPHNDKEAGGGSFFPPQKSQTTEFFGSISSQMNVPVLDKLKQSDIPVVIHITIL